MTSTGTSLARLLVHLPSSKNSARRFVVPLINRRDVEFDVNDPKAVLASLKYNRVVQGRFHPKRLDVAVKVVPWSRSDLAWNEVEMLSLVGKHPFILDLHGVSQDKDESFLVVTELVPHGLTLEQYCVKQSQANHATPDLRLLNQLARAMVHVHSHSVVHRDLKASNVFVTKSKDVSTTIALADFDRSTVLLEGNSLAEPCGSLFHMAPELLRWEPYDHKVDIYAFGVLLFEVAHGGSSPYPGSIGSGLPGTMTQEEFAKRVSAEENPLRPKWSFPDNNLRRLAERCWHPSKSERPEFEEIAEMLQREFPLGEDHLRAIHHHQNSERMNSSMMQLSPSVGTSASIGQVRTSMEDSLAILQTSEGDTTVCAVFDGLRDSRTSEFAAKKFGLNVFESLSHGGDTTMDAGTIREALVRVDQALAKVVPNIECGSTATVVSVDPKQLCVGWLGDSSAYLFRRTVHPDQKPSVHYQAVSLITKHSPDRSDELERIHSKKGSVGREFKYLDNGEKMPVGPWRAFMPKPAVEGETDYSRMGMAVSRALGLFPFRPVISGEPDFVALDRDKDKDEFLVIASDGLWDVLSLPQVLQTVLDSGDDAQAAADLMVKRVLQVGAFDNVSVIVLRLGKGGASPNATSSGVASSTSRS